MKTSDTDSADDEKKVGVRPGEFESLATHQLPPDPDEDLSDAERAKIDRKLLLKLDFRLIPWLCLLYLISFLDRTNIGNARLDGLEETLGITGMIIVYLCFPSTFHLERMGNNNCN